MINEKIILGIDPGTTIMGYGIINVHKKKFELISMGVLDLAKLKTHELKLKKIFERTLQLIEEYKPDELAVEAPFFGKNVQSMLKLAILLQVTHLSVTEACFLLSLIVKVVLLFTLWMQRRWVACQSMMELMSHQFLQQEAM